jgi:hypothetical protein
VPTGGGRLARVDRNDLSVDIRLGTIPKAGGSSNLSGDSLLILLSGSSQTDVMCGSGAAVLQESQTPTAPARTTPMLRRRSQ